MNVAPAAFLSINGDNEDLSMSFDQKVITLLSIIEDALWTSIKEFFCCQNLITVALVTRDKEIC